MNFHGQLQDTRPLTGPEAVQEHDRAVGKFQGVVVHIGPLRIYLPKAGYGAGQLAPPPPHDGAPAFGRVIEHELRARPQADRYVGLVDSGKPVVIVWGNYLVISSSPTFAGRDATPCRL